MNRDAGIGSKDKKAGWDVGDRTRSRNALEILARAYGEDTTMLDRILCGEKLWHTHETLDGGDQRAQMRKVKAKIDEEHQFLIDNEPQDHFHACVLLGALNLIDGLLDKRRKVKHGLV